MDLDVFCKKREQKLNNEDLVEPTNRDSQLSGQRLMSTVSREIDVSATKLVRQKTTVSKEASMVTKLNTLKE